MRIASIADRGCLAEGNLFGCHPNDRTLLQGLRDCVIRVPTALGPLAIPNQPETLDVPCEPFACFSFPLNFGRFHCTRTAGDPLNSSSSPRNPFISKRVRPSYASNPNVRHPERFSCVSISTLQNSPRAYLNSPVFQRLHRFLPSF